MFKYQDIAMPEECKFKISPSQIDKFFKLPVVWYTENILGEKEDFNSTAMALGTVCHHVFELVGKGEPVNKDYIEEQVVGIEDDNVNALEVLDNYVPIVESVVNEYLLANMPTKTEYQVYTEVKEGIYVGGSIDNVTNSIVVDYKNVSTKPNDKQIPFNYKIQLLAYAYILNRNNYFIDRIRIVYGVRPTKTLPARTIVVTEEIGYQDWEMIENTLELMADTVLLVKEKPELAYLLFKSMRLKEE